MKTKEAPSCSILEHPYEFRRIGIVGGVAILGIIVILVGAGTGVDFGKAEYVWIAYFALYTVFCIWKSPVWFSRLVFTPDEIQRRRPFHQREYILYSEYARVYRGAQWNFGRNEPFPPQFLVLARRELSEEELACVTGLEDPEDAIVLRMTKQRYKRLLSALPANIRRVVERDWGEEFGGE